MTQPLPWEPVKVQYFDKEAVWLGSDFPFDVDDWETVATLGPDWESRVTLANGQRVIVRKLSEERKATGAFEKRVRKAVEANR